MQELDTISIRGFKSIASIENLKLGPINVIIGSNGSGKSNFIGAFSFLNALREGRLQEYVALAGGASRLLHFGARRTPVLYMLISFEGGVNQYEVFLKPTANDELRPITENVAFWDKAAYPTKPYWRSIDPTGTEAGISRAGAARIADYVRWHLGRWRVYHFHDTGPNSPMKETASVDDNQYLKPNGSNIAAFLYFLQKTQPISYRLIQRTVGLVAPFFDDFQLEPLRLNPTKVRLDWKHKGSEAFFDASSLSDGTLRFIALATLFLQPKEMRPSVIVVDEPELGLHPYAIEMLANLVKQASSDTQVIISTQSSLLLDHFEPEDVLVADRADGGTTLHRLDSGELQGWLETYSLGQLWEKGNVGGRPGRE